MLENDEKILANRILNELDETKGAFGISYIQIKYLIGFSRATRIVEYYKENGLVEEGDFGTVTMENGVGEKTECKLKYKIKNM